MLPRPTLLSKALSLSLLVRPRKGRRNWLGCRFFFVAMVSLLIVAVSSIPSAHAFGAGNIPSFAYMEGKAFRHGDIEDILEDLAKKVGGSLFGASKFGASTSSAPTLAIGSVITVRLWTLLLCKR